MVVRCDAIVIQLIVTIYDEQGRPVSEQTSTPTKVFRAACPDVWAEADKAVAASLQGKANAETA